jgi:hypothetical protein
MAWQGVIMGLNKYRDVEYSDDGCEVYECMACKAQWEVRYFPTAYCGNCGIKFEGQHECRGHYTPRWEYERFDGHYWDERDYETRRAEDKEKEAIKAKEKVWVIQKRITLLESEYSWDYESDAEPFPRVGEWRDEYRSDRPAWLHPARDIHAELVRHRKYDNDLAEAEAYTQRIEKKQLCETVTEAGGDVSEWGCDRVTVEKFEHRVVTKFRGDARGSVIYYRER